MDKQNIHPGYLTFPDKFFHPPEGLPGICGIQRNAFLYQYAPNGLPNLLIVTAVAFKHISIYEVNGFSADACFTDTIQVAVYTVDDYLAAPGLAASNTDADNFTVVFIDYLPAYKAGLSSAGAGRVEYIVKFNFVAIFEVQNLFIGICIRLCSQIAVAAARDKVRLIPLMP